MPAVIEARDVSRSASYLSSQSAAELKVRVLGLFDGSPRQRVEEFWALKSVSLQIADGESVGLVGRNGSGKSTLLKVIAGIHRPTGGQLLVARGTRISSMIELGTGFHPELTGQENVMLNTSIHGLSRAEALEVYDDVVAYSGPAALHGRADQELLVGHAHAARLRDRREPRSRRAAARRDLRRRRRGLPAAVHGHARIVPSRGKTLVFVSHSSAAVQAICRRVCLLDHGRLLYDGTSTAG